MLPNIRGRGASTVFPLVGCVAEREERSGDPTPLTFSRFLGTDHASVVPAAVLGDTTIRTGEVNLPIEQLWRADH